MSDIKKQILKLQNCLINRGVRWSVYDFNAYTTQELIFQMCHKINETIDNVEEFTKLTLSLYDFVVGEGLYDSVNKKLDDMLENGGLAYIIDSQIFGGLKQDLIKLKDELTKYKDDVSKLIDNISNELDEQIKENIKNMNSEIKNVIDNFTNKYSTYFEFDLRKITPSRHGYVMLKKTRVGQGIGINNNTGELFATRVYNDSKPSEDYLIARFNESGEKVSSIVFENGGHGTSFGVESIYNNNTLSYDSYIWSNVNIVNSSGQVTGNKVVRYKYDDSINSLNINSRGVEIIETGSSLYSIPSIDDVNDLIGFCRKQNGRYFIEIYKLSEIKRGVINKIGTLDLSQNNDFLQGFAISGEYVFWRIGTSDESLQDLTYVYNWKENKYLYTVKSGTLDPVLKDTDKTEGFREAEGICVYTNPQTKDRSLFLMTIIGGQNRRKHLIHTYHQGGNSGVFASRVNGAGQQKAFTKPDGQSLDIPREFTKLSQVKETGHYYIQSDQITNFSDRPIINNSDGWYLIVGGKKNGYEQDAFQLMVRNNKDETDVYLRINRSTEPTPWIYIKTTDGLRVGTETTIKQLNKTGEYYLTTSDFDKMSDKPSQASSGGYFLLNSAKNPDGTFTQTLTLNSTTKEPKIYFRVINTSNVGKWYLKSFVTE